MVDPAADLSHRTVKAPWDIVVCIKTSNRQLQWVGAGSVSGSLLHHCWNWNLRHKQVKERDSPSQPRLHSARRRTEPPAATSSSAVSLLTCLSVCSPARCLQDWPPAAIYSPGWKPRISNHSGAEGAVHTLTHSYTDSASPALAKHWEIFKCIQVYRPQIETPTNKYSKSKNNKMWPGWFSRTHWWRYRSEEIKQELEHDYWWRRMDTDHWSFNITDAWMLFFSRRQFTTPQPQKRSGQMQRTNITVHHVHLTNKASSSTKSQWPVRTSDAGGIWAECHFVVLDGLRTHTAAADHTHTHTINTFHHNTAVYTTGWDSDAQ